MTEKSIELDAKTDLGREDSILVTESDVFDGVCIETPRGDKFFITNDAFRRLCEWGKTPFGQR